MVLEFVAVKESVVEMAKAIQAPAVFPGERVDQMEKLEASMSHGMGWRYTSLFEDHQSTFGVDFFSSQEWCHR